MSLKLPSLFNNCKHALEVRHVCISETCCLVLEIRSLLITDCVPQDSKVRSLDLNDEELLHHISGTLNRALNPKTWVLKGGRGFCFRFGIRTRLETLA